MRWLFLISCLLFKILPVKGGGERRCKESAKFVIFSGFGAGEQKQFWGRIGRAMKFPHRRPPFWKRKKKKSI